MERQAMCFTISTSSTKVHMGVLQLKGNALLWRKMLLPQLNMVVEAVLGERFKEGFWRSNCERNSLSVSSMSSTP
jgi:hypothetical protein